MENKIKFILESLVSESFRSKQKVSPFGGRLAPSLFRQEKNGKGKGRGKGKSEIFVVYCFSQTYHR